MLFRPNKMQEKPFIDSNILAMVMENVIIFL